MKQKNCLNLCELLSYLLIGRNVDQMINFAMKEANYEECERIYIGSSFCGKYFLGQQEKELRELFALCRERNIKVTLTIPTFSEGDLEKGKRKVEQIVENGKEIIDELTVNDFGALMYFKTLGLSMNTGRLFMKDYRDPRYEEYFQIPWEPKMFTKYFRGLLQEYKIAGCEFDLTHKYMDFSNIPEEIMPAIHVPYTYQTVGRICEYASIHKELSKKFRANDNCDRACTENQIKYSVSDGNMEYVRFGRTVYYKHPGFEFKGLNTYRFIYFPID